MRNTLFNVLLFLLLAAAGYVVLAYSLDPTYDPTREQASGSSSEAKKRGTLIRQILPHKTAFHTNPQSDEHGNIENIWIEKSWLYKPNNVLNKMRGIHPTTLASGTVLVVRFSGSSASEYGGIGNWEFSLNSTAAGGTFGQGYQVLSLKPDITSLEKLYVVRAPLDQSKPTVIVDSIKLH